MIAAMALALGAQPTMHTRPNPGAPAVAGVAFSCTMTVDGKQFTMAGTTPTFPEGHPTGVGLPMEVETSVPTKFSGKRWMFLDSASQNHRRYYLNFRFDEEPDVSLDLVFLKGAKGMGVMNQANPDGSPLPRWPGQIRAKAECLSDWTVATEGKSQ